MLACLAVPPIRDAIEERHDTYEERYTAEKDEDARHGCSLPIRDTAKITKKIQRTTPPTATNGENACSPRN